jgi:hypothetical protein
MNRNDDPPVEDDGWEDEYDEMMKSDAATAMLSDLWRMPDDAPDIGGHRTDLNDAVAVKIDDDELQAFVQMVYDRGIKHGERQANEANRLANDLIIDRIAAFNAECEHHQFTDTGAAWELLDGIVSDLAT